MDILSTLHLDINSLSKGGELMLLEVRPVKRYIDQKPSDEVDYRCTVVAIKNGFNKFDIVVNEKPGFNVEEGTPLPVVFNELTVKIYRRPGDETGYGAAYGLSCKAKNVMLAKKA